MLITTSHIQPNFETFGSYRMSSQGIQNSDATHKPSILFAPHRRVKTNNLARLHRIEPEGVTLHEFTSISGLYFLPINRVIGVGGQNENILAIIYVMVQGNTHVFGIQK